MNKSGDRPREQHMIPVGDRHNTGCTVDGGTVIIAGAELSFARVQSHTDMQGTDFHWPGLRFDRLLTMKRRLQPVGG